MYRDLNSHIKYIYIKNFGGETKWISKEIHILTKRINTNCKRIGFIFGINKRLKSYEAQMRLQRFDYNGYQSSP